MTIVFKEIRKCSVNFSFKSYLFFNFFYFPIQLTAEHRLKIVCLHGQKITQGKIVEQIGVSKSTVLRLFSKYKELDYLCI
ncbi:hypothetical protein AAJ76_3100035588 [Vairimorpha ceranae]|uniref:Uncharacterized protein n=1 Tax=Vairimorpha ceranae TaxID=40302 RepID=A0A0F9WQA9_9MICR|nr:hypothetical protein AAJ76_3100035588 [Vairimorpha ceranae]KKO75133.1 hypothetical protein AAJ76_3100035588 [Vairimorpha ceranae]